MPFIDCLTKASSTLKTYWVVCRKHSLENREFYFYDRDYDNDIEKSREEYHIADYCVYIQVLSC